MHGVTAGVTLADIVQGGLRGEKSSRQIASSHLTSNRVQIYTSTGLQVLAKRTMYSSLTPGLLLRTVRCFWI